MGAGASSPGLGEAEARGCHYAREPVERAARHAVAPRESPKLAPLRGLECRGERGQQAALTAPRRSNVRRRPATSRPQRPRSRAVLRTARGRVPRRLRSAADSISTAIAPLAAGGLLLLRRRKPRRSRSRGPRAAGRRSARSARTSAACHAGSASNELPSAARTRRGRTTAPGARSATSPPAKPHDTRRARPRRARLSPRARRVRVRSRFAGGRAEARQAESVCCRLARSIPRATMTATVAGAAAAACHAAVS
jgi:hypothetical protein